MRFLREAFNSFGLLRSFFVMELMIASCRDDFLVFETTGLIDHLFHFAHARQQPHDRAHATHIAHLPKLLGEIIHIELALGHFLGLFLGAFNIHFLGRFFDQRNNVAHAENAARHAFRLERIERVYFFADADKLNRRASHRTHGKRGAAARVTVDTGHDNARNRHALLKPRRRFDRVLTGQRVNHEERFNGGSLRHEYQRSQSSTVRRWKAGPLCPASRRHNRLAFLPRRRGLRYREDFGRQ